MPDAVICSAYVRICVYVCYLYNLCVCCGRLGAVWLQYIYVLNLIENRCTILVKFDKKYYILNCFLLYKILNFFLICLLCISVTAILGVVQRLLYFWHCQLSRANDVASKVILFVVRFYRKLLLLSTRPQPVYWDAAKVIRRGVRAPRLRKYM